MSLDSHILDPVLQKQTETLQSRIQAACESSGRDTASVTLIAVTKTFSSDVIRKACALGIDHLGENRAQEILDKFGNGSIQTEYPQTVLHMIGHLQSNKVRKIVPLCASVDSVDSVALAQTLNLEAEAARKRLRILIEVNASGESQKFGVRPADLFQTIEKILALPHLDLAGLMTVGPLTSDPRGIRQSFRILKNSFEEIRSLLNPPAWSTLSMGMSGDFEIAIEEGSTEVRIGTALFGDRRAL
jgi:PLP dependent protein